MASKAEEIVKKIDELPDAEKAMLVDVILAKLDQPDAELDKIWAEKRPSDGLPIRKDVSNLSHMMMSWRGIRKR